ncbi:MAG: helix-turn-helix domain-containing protein [Labilithrix sp.]|nr:helix-turn-helix domain-containing protein [Labilithrix sp.]
MSDARIRSAIADIRARLLDIERVLDAAEASKDEGPSLMTIDAYAAHAHVSTATVRRWLRKGLPCVRRGHVVRIKVAEADAWTPAEELERSASYAAHRGRR